MGHVSHRDCFVAGACPEPEGGSSPWQSLISHRWRPRVSLLWTGECRVQKPGQRKQL